MAIHTNPEQETASSDYNYQRFARSVSRDKASAFMHTLRVGAEAPDFELPTLEGERVRLSAFRGEAQ